MTSESIAIGSRRVAPDVTRAVALIGVVTMNYHGTMNDVRVPHGFWEHLFHPYTGVLSTRFAATFVLMAGIGVALMASNTPTQSIPGEAGIRSRLARRGVLLYAAGLALNHAWAGTILFYYGAYLCIAAIIVHLASKHLVLIAGAAIVGGAALRSWLVSRPSAASPIEWLNPREVDSIADLFGRTFTGYTHPILPWIAFFIAGILIGRHLDRFERASGRIAVFTATCTVILYIAIDALERFQSPDRAWVGGLLSTEPFDRGLGYSLTTLAIAVTAFAVITTIVRSSSMNAVLDHLRRAGQMTLSLYLGHVVVYYVLFRWWTLVEPHGLHTAIIVSTGYWVVGVGVASLWTRRFGKGPAERVYRAVGG
ncbi:MAG: DUF418 domain-containing protein [Ilumatobacteraceae bacterium]